MILIKKILICFVLFCAPVLQAAEFEVMDILTVNGITNLKSSVTIIVPDTVPSSIWISTSAATPHLYISTNGNVGIGTASPIRMLDINGSISAARYQINGSTVVAILQGTSSFGMGIDAGKVNMGSYNSFFGGFTGQSNISGSNNSFVGHNAGAANTSGGYNSYVGYATGLASKTGSANTIMGSYAGYGLSGNSFSSSTLMGYKSGFALTTGSDNILLGFQAGNSLTAGASNIIIGYDEDAPTAATNNYLNIGGIIVSEMANSSVTILGDLYANSFYGDGSNLDNVPGDNLGNHVATTTLDMANFDIVNIGSMTVDNGEGGISIAPYFDPTKRYSGDDGVAIGSDTYSNYNHGVGVGYLANSNHSNGVGIGRSAQNNYNNGVGVGYAAYDNYNSGVGVGRSAYNNHDNGVGVGYNANTNLTGGVGVGYNASSNYTYGVGVGYEAYNNRSHGVGVGRGAQGNDDFAVGVGAYSQNNGTYGAGIGAYAVANSSSVALGSYAKANAKESLALGAGTVNNSTGTANFGVYAVHTDSHAYVGGNVGIGTTSPSSKLTVQNGDIKISTNSGSSGVIFQDGSIQQFSGKVINVTYRVNSTRTPLSVSSSITMESFTVDKKSSTSNLIIQGTISGWGNASGDMQQGWKFGSGTEFIAQSLMYSDGGAGASYSKIYQTGAVIIGHSTTGPQTLVFRYYNNGGSATERPFVTYNPNSSEDPRITQTSSVYTVWEVEPQ